MAGKGCGSVFVEAVVKPRNDLYALFLANTVWYAATGEIPDAAFAMDPDGAFAVDPAAGWLMRTLMERVEPVYEVVSRILEGVRPDGGVDALVPLIEVALARRQFGSPVRLASSQVFALEEEVAAVIAVEASGEARRWLRAVAAELHRDPRAAWRVFVDGLADIIRGVSGLGSMIEAAYSAVDVLQQMHAFDILVDADVAELDRLRRRLLDCMVRIYNNVVSSPTSRELALRYARARLRESDLMPRLETMRRYAAGGDRADTAVAVARVLWHSGVIARLRAIVEHAQSAGGRVWFLGRDADALYAYYHALGYGCVRYLPGINRSMVSAYPQVVEAIAKLMLRPGDYVVDTGFAGTCVRPLVVPSGAIGVLVSSSRGIRDMMCLDDLLSDALRRSVREAVLILEDLCDDYDRLCWRGERASYVEIDCGVPRERWNRSILPLHSKFICDFVDELLALEGTAPDPAAARLL